VLADKPLGERLGTAARERVLARFTFEQTVAGVQSVYAEVGVS
jgi:hypothetical protein